MKEPWEFSRYIGTSGRLEGKWLLESGVQSLAGFGPV